MDKDKQKVLKYCYGHLFRCQEVSEKDPACSDMHQDHKNPEDRCECSDRHCNERKLKSMYREIK